MGAAATPLAFGEIYTALQAGVLDGLEHDPPTILASKFYETAKILFAHRAQFLGARRVLQRRRPSTRMPASLRDPFLAAAAKAATDTRVRGLEAEKEAMEALKQKGVTIIAVDKRAVPRARAAADRCVHERASRSQADHRHHSQRQGLTLELRRETRGTTERSASDRGRSRLPRSAAERRAGAVAERGGRGRGALAGGGPLRGAAFGVLPLRARGPDRVVRRRRPRADGGAELLRRGGRSRAQREHRRRVLRAEARTADARARGGAGGAGRARHRRLDGVVCDRARALHDGPDDGLGPAARTDFLSDGRGRRLHDGFRARSGIGSRRPRLGGQPSRSRSRWPPRAGPGVGSPPA